MPSEAKTTKEYLNSLPDDRKKGMTLLYDVLVKHLPKGFSETMGYGMITFVVPHSLYPKGYHVNPKQALPFISMASQKNFIALYHMGIYGNPDLLKWFTAEYVKQTKSKPDMGKSCIRFKRVDLIPFQLIADLAKKITVKQFVTIYEKNLNR